MIRVRRAQLWRGVGTVSLVLLVLAGCGPSGGDGGSATARTSRVTLRLAFPESALSRSARRATAPAQLRQAELITRLEVTVTGADITPAISARCDIPGPSTDPQCSSVTETEKFIEIVVELSGPCPELTVELCSQCLHLVLFHLALGRLVLCSTLGFEALEELLQFYPIKLPVERAGLLVGKVLVGLLQSSAQKVGLGDVSASKLNARYPTVIRASI